MQLLKHSVLQPTRLDFPDMLAAHAHAHRDLFLVVWVSALNISSVKLRRNSMNTTTKSISDIKVGTYKAVGDGITEAVRNAFSLNRAYGHIVHYWWNEMDSADDAVCLVAFYLDDHTMFMTVRGNYTASGEQEWTIDLERIINSDGHTIDYSEEAL
jgi:hypothetical protein